MIRRVLTALVIACLLCPPAMAATPNPPYGQVSDGTVLTAAWLNDMFATIYAWAQTHHALTHGVHGVTGTLVGTTDNQTLTNKHLDSAELDGVTHVNGTIDGGTMTNTTLLDGVYLVNLASWTFVSATQDTAANVGSGGAVIDFKFADASPIDVLGEYDQGTGVFTALATGVYLVTAQITAASATISLNSEITVALYHHGFVYESHKSQVNAMVGDMPVAALSAAVTLNAGEAIKVQATSNNATMVTCAADSRYNFLQITRLH